MEGGQEGRERGSQTGIGFEGGTVGGRKGIQKNIAEVIPMDMAGIDEIGPGAEEGHEGRSGEGVEAQPLVAQPHEGLLAVLVRNIQGEVADVEDG